LLPLLARGPALAQDPAPGFEGRVVVSDEMIAPASAFPSSASMLSALRRLERAVVSGSRGFWRLQLVAFLRRPAPATGQLWVIANDVTDPARPKQVRAFEVDGEPGALELRVNDLVITSAMGFSPGRRYELLVAPADLWDPFGKQDVYARGVVTLR
jgi:hypothetical protein